MEVGEDVLSSGVVGQIADKERVAPVFGFLSFQRLGSGPYRVVIDLTILFLPSL